MIGALRMHSNRKTFATKFTVGVLLMAKVTLFTPCDMTLFPAPGLATYQQGTAQQTQVTQEAAAAFLYGSVTQAGSLIGISVTSAIFDTNDGFNIPDFYITDISVGVINTFGVSEILAACLAGNDLIVGSSGADILAGSTGNDTYVVTQGDVIIEALNEGIDTVQSDGSLDLTNYANVENVKLTGTLAVAALGNSGSNVIDGSTNSAANALTGLGAADTYIVGAGDTIFEAVGGGTDRVQSSLISLNLASYANVENASLTGSAALNLTGNGSSNSLSGNSANNVISSGGGNDAINSGAGRDTVTGGTGQDYFVFSTALSATTNVDTITDFLAIDDTIRLENSIFTGLGSTTGTLAAGKFWASSTGLAHDADDRIIYNTSTGVLTYDSNGNAAGGAVAFATLANKASISAGDFLVI